MRNYYWKLIGPGWTRYFLMLAAAEAYAENFIAEHGDHKEYALVLLQVPTKAGTASGLKDCVENVFLPRDAYELPIDMHDGLTVDGVVVEFPMNATPKS